MLSMHFKSALLTLSMLSNLRLCNSFAPLRNAFSGSCRPDLCHHHSRYEQRFPSNHVVLFLSSEPEDKPDADGANLMAELFRVAQSKGIALDAKDLEEGDEEEEEVDDDEDDSDSRVASEMPPEEGGGQATFTDDKLYSEVKERVLDTAGGFVDYVTGVNDDDDDEDDGDELSDTKAEDTPKPYEPPTKVPDSDLTAGEVVSLVLEAFRNNDNPTPNRGAEIFFGYSSDGSQVKTEEELTPAEYAAYLKTTEYKVLFTHTEAFVEKGDYSFDGKRAFFTASVKVGPGPLDRVSVNFILSACGSGEDMTWMIDSMLIRPGSMRRNRRR